MYFKAQGNYLNQMVMYILENLEMVYLVVKEHIFGKMKNWNTQVNLEMVFSMVMVSFTTRVEFMKETLRKEWWLVKV